MDEISLVFAALADPSRRAILARLTQGEATVSELAQPFNMTMQAVSKHVRVLEAAGLVSQRIAAQTRPCRIEPAALQRVDKYFDLFRPFWDERFDRLAEYLKGRPAAAREEGEGES